MSVHKKMLKTSDYDRRLIGLLLLPSWLSGLVAVCGGLAVTVASIVISRYQGSSLQLELFNYRATPAPNLTTSYQTVGTNLSANTFVSDLPLFLFWALAGLIVYLFASSLFGVLQNVAELKSELDYVHTDRRQLIDIALLHLAFRLGVLLFWLPYLLFFFHHVVPYSIAAAHVASASLISLNGLMYSLLAFLVIAGSLHIHAILLRLLFLKPRVFTNALYLD
jgi:hypothetical protein